MKNDIFNKEFWISQWGQDKEGDTYKVHKGFSTPEYWDKAAQTYNQDEKEIRDRRLEKTISFLKHNDLVFDGMKVLDIGCGTGLVSIELAKHGAEIVGLDFSSKMLERFKKDLTPDLEKKVNLICDDFFNIDINKQGWVKQFDLVIGFMSPGVATPEALFKMMDCSKNGCAIRGWAAKRSHPILSELWKEIVGKPLEDKPQSILYKINLLFSMGFFPEISFDAIEWTQCLAFNQELNNQLAFFKKVSQRDDTELKALIMKHLDKIAQDGIITKKQRGLTATAVWKIGEQYP